MEQRNIARGKPLVFVSYAREDNDTKKGWLNRLLPFLKRPLDQAGIELFIDRNIITGEYSPKIKSALNRASAAILLISPAFMDSDYIIEKELPILLSRYKAGLLDLFPVLISYCPWDIVYINYPDPSQENQIAKFLLSRLLLPGHDPNHPIDSMTDSEINKIFKKISAQIITYHFQEKNSNPHRTEISNAKPEPNHPPSEKNETGSENRPSWASEAGVDKYGIYADFILEGINQRMRWIEPGSFLMGSPLEERNREKDEHQHRVIHPNGFWLANTACTQELWEAVMGNNPSLFRGNRLPVDSISWEMTQLFFTKCHNLNPELSLRLPSEAEWEYACRAGTTTPFFFGNTITTDQANFNGDSSANNGTQGTSRIRPVEVTALPCNSWGLYQMHGNLWEWCEDWYSAHYYLISSEYNPRGPVRQGMFKVISVLFDKLTERVRRGGCWNDSMCDVRSACRYQGEPDHKYQNSGFRFCTW